jgi:hypothetical protein
MRHAPAALLCAALVVASAAGRAHAYSDLARFGDPTAMGGGDGHWFTGAPGDGYTCAVCHENGSAAPVSVSGLPKRYQPGATYEVVLTWPTTVQHVSALLELTDEHGRAAGSILLPGESEMAMAEADTCQPIGRGIPAAERFAAPDANVPAGRQLIGITDDCGAPQLRLQWTAPNTSAGTVFLSGGVVQSDDHDDLLNDGVVELSRPILPASQPEYTIDTHGGCSAVVARSSAPRSLLGFAVACAIVLNRSRRRRR